jgi:NAD-dependent deacetylase
MDGIEALAMLLKEVGNNNKEGAFAGSNLLLKSKDTLKNNAIESSHNNTVTDSNSNNIILLITGAGLSKSSGIPTYRSNALSSTTDGNNATWSRFVYKWGTRRKFLKDPLSWYNTFWLQTHHKKEYLQAEPSKGHRYIADLCKKFSSIRVVTQNIDGLHLKGEGAIENERIVEVHGHLTYYKCINEECPTYATTIKNVKLDYDNNNSDCKTTSREKKNNKMKNILKTVPKCSECSAALLPQSLFFDEDYESHPFYQYEKVEEWMEQSKAIIFVGTSNSVGITTNAVLEARRRRIPVRSVVPLY